MQRKNIELQPTDNWHILKTNLTTVLPKSSVFRFEYAVPVILIGYLASFVVTIPGAIIKTIVDIHTRKKLTNDELQTTITQVKQFDDEKIDQLINAVSTVYPAYQASSDSSKQLLQGFRDAETNEEKKFKTAKKNEILKNKKDAIDKQIQVTRNLATQSGVNVNINANYHDTKLKLSYEEKADLNQEIADNQKTFKNTAREKNKQAILSFLNEPYNAGKKLQHVIKEAAASLVTRFN